MEDKFHPLVELMLARMKSHPEEFEGEVGSSLYVPNDVPVELRWSATLYAMEKYLISEEQEALQTSLRAIRMDAIHRYAMDELLNGDERRRKEEEDRAQYAATMQTATASVAPQAYNQLRNAYTSQSALRNAYTSQSALGLVGSIRKGLGI